MRQPNWQRWKKRFIHRPFGLLPGVTVISLIVLCRFAGLLQGWEWKLLDYCLRLRPAEPTDSRITVVAITEQDIQRIGQYPIPDGQLADLIEALLQYEPRAVGLDLFRDLPVEPGHAELINLFQTHDNLIAIERVLPPAVTMAPNGVPESQVGFVDSLLDEDSFLRRSLLGTSDVEGNYKLSFTIRLAQQYLEEEGIELTNGSRDPVAMRFGATELTRFQPNTGAYVRGDSGGNQILLNFRSGDQPFQVVAMEQVLTGEVSPALLQDRLVLIGVTASSIKDTVNSAAIQSSNPGLVTGIEIQAHAISQILSAVLDGRPLLRSWPDGWEYVWIIGWGILGMSLSRLTRSPTQHLTIVAIASLALFLAGYGLLIVGWWIPLVPAWLVFFLNSVVLYGFYWYDQVLRSRIEERQFVIERTFDIIHNGPLQTLAHILSQHQEQGLPPQQLQTELGSLNQELRSIYESMRRETLMQGSQLYLNSDRILDLQVPLHELLYEVYSNTLERNFPCFATIRAKIVKFEPMNVRSLTLEEKRELGRFLEEALCNVGKYAKGTTRLTIVCAQVDDYNLIRVADNGIGLDAAPEPEKAYLAGGRGTQQAKKLARKLGGTFQRLANKPQGTICELRWPIVRSRFRKFW